MGFKCVKSELLLQTVSNERKLALNTSGSSPEEWNTETTLKVRAPGQLKLQHSLGPKGVQLHLQRRCLGGIRMGMALPAE